MEEQIVDDGYKNIRIRMDSTIIATQEIIDHVSISYGCTDGSAPAFGGTYSPHCEIEINSNNIVGDENLSHIRMGKQFYIECELTEGTYTNMGVFEINQPPMYTDDYSISFSGEGMLGSVLDRAKMDWSLMQSYSSKGIITVNQALKMFEDQFGISVSMRSDTKSDYGSAKVIVPLKLRKWKKGVAFKKRFVKITAREWLAGLATLMMGNVVEYGYTISIVTIGEAWDNGIVTEGKYFSEDSYVSDYQSEKIPYAPNSLILNTYETLPVKTKSKTKTTTHGFCYIEECTSRSVYSHIDIDQKNPNKYNVYVDCQWIGKSFETFYYNGGDPYEETDMEDDYPSYNIMASKFAYVPCSFEFSGWHEMFTPGKFVQIQTSQKNTETQETSYSYVYAYIMEMTLNWDGTITVNVSSSYNGDSASVTVTIGHDDVADAWNSGTNIEEQAVEELPDPQETLLEVSQRGGINTPATTTGILISNDNLFLIGKPSNNNYPFQEYDKNSQMWSAHPSNNDLIGEDKYNGFINACVYQGQIHTFRSVYNKYGASIPFDPDRLSDYHHVWNGQEWVRSFDIPEFYRESSYHDTRYSEILSCFVLKNELYIYVYGQYNDISGQTNVIYRWGGSDWVYVCGGNGSLWVSNTTRYVEYNGELHLFDSYHKVFNGESVQTLEHYSDIGLNVTSGFSYKDNLYVIAGKNYFDYSIYIYLYGEYIKIGNLPSQIRGGQAIVYDDEILIFNYESPTNGTYYVLESEI